MNRLELCLLLATGTLGLAGQASPATINDNFGPAGVNFLTGATISAAVPGFNPALGTLTMAAFTYQSSAVLLIGNAISSDIRINDPNGTLVATIVFPNITGRAQQAENGSFNIPSADLNGFLSVGNVDLRLSPFTACRGSAHTPTGCIGFSGVIDGSVVYTYTPVSPAPTAAPEPLSLALLGAGFILFGLWRGHALQRRLAGKRQYE